MPEHVTEFVVRYASGAYNTRAPNGKTASSTMSAKAAAERLADKIFGKEVLRVEQVGSQLEDLRTTWRVFLKEA